MLYKQLDIHTRIDTWFPKSVYSVTNFHIDKLNLYENKILSIQNKSNFIKHEEFDIISSYNKNQILNHNIFLDLKNDIIEHSKNYLNQLGLSEEKTNNVKIINSWFNISNKNDSVNKHIHSESFLSGAYYIKSDENDLIYFHKEDDMLLHQDNLNELSFNKVAYECREGVLLLFKSNLNHSTNKHKGNGKIVISFNINL